jgi:selenocysteine lyase/cysteine desulfurase
MLEVQRHLFDIPDDIAYLNCATMAPALRSVVAAGQEAVQRAASPWHLRPADFFSGVEALRERFAGLVGADADGVAIIPSASYALGTAAANLPLEPGERILVVAEQFPSNVYPWRAMARQRDAEVVTVARPEDADWTSAVRGAIDERTRIVAVPNCHWTDGTLVDLGPVREACDQVGAALVVDASQSLGALPLSVAEVRPDVLVAVGYKWLLGPFSLGYAWFAPHLRDGVPLEENWFARAGSEDFAGLVAYTDDYQPGARRYDVGEVAKFAILPMATAALGQIGEWGIPSIARTLRERTDEVVAGAEELGLTAAPRKHRAPHMVGLGLPPGADPAEVAEALRRRDVHVSVRGRSVRVAPHLWTTPADVERLHSALAAAVRD